MCSQFSYICLYVLCILHICNKSCYWNLYSVVMPNSRTIPVERCRHTEKGQPMCMDQHYRLFSSYRVPGREQDICKTDRGKPGRDFIIVACRNQVRFYLFRQITQIKKKF